jgi:hypothetical protein
MGYDYDVLVIGSGAGRLRRRPAADREGRYRPAGEGHRAQLPRRPRQRPGCLPAQSLSYRRLPGE